MLVIIASHPSYPHSFESVLDECTTAATYLAALYEYLRNINRDPSLIDWELIVS